MMLLLQQIQNHEVQIFSDNASSGGIPLKQLDSQNLHSDGIIVIDLQTISSIAPDYLTSLLNISYHTILLLSQDTADQLIDVIKNFNIDVQPIIDDPAVPTVKRFVKLERNISISKGLRFSHHMGAPYHPAPLLRPGADSDMTFFSSAYSLIYLKDLKTETVAHVVSILGFTFDWKDEGHIEFLKSVTNLRDDSFRKPKFQNDGQQDTFKKSMRDLDEAYDALPEEKRKKIDRALFKKMAGGFADLLDENKNKEAKMRKAKIMEKLNKELKDRFGENSSASWGAKNQNPKEEL